MYIYIYIYLFIYTYTHTHWIYTSIASNPTDTENTSSDLVKSMLSTATTLTVLVCNCKMRGTWWKMGKSHIGIPVLVLLGPLARLTKVDFWASITCLHLNSSSPTLPKPGKNKPFQCKIKFEIDFGTLSNPPHSTCGLKLLPHLLPP